MQPDNPVQPDNPNDETAVRSLYQAILDAWNDRDAARYASLSPRTATSSGSTAAR